MPTPEQLKGFLAKQYADRDDADQRREGLYDRTNLIASAGAELTTDFYCPKHSIEFRAMAVRCVEVDWVLPNQEIAYYVALAPPCGCTGASKPKRYITDKFTDPYFKLSKIINRQRQVQYGDMLQPTDEGFKALYGDKYTRR